MRTKNRIAVLGGTLLLMGISTLVAPTAEADAAAASASSCRTDTAERMRRAMADPPTSREVAALAPAAVSGARHATASTDGGRMEVTLTWTGTGPYRGRVFGSVTDTNADGQCAFVRIWKDGNIRVIGDDACPEGETASVKGTYRGTWRALLSVCAEDCSDWV
ncbi:MAG: hypothetical protein ACRDQ0_12110 [Pseudonocardia sp.]